MAAQDEYWMRQAIETASGGRFIAPPNPAVGCVIVRDGEEISRGFTQRPGGHHAEIEALEKAAALGRSVRGATVYVTLEPCSHYGRTPPCALRLIHEGVGRVVAATADPNPLVAGRGLRMLEQAGIQTVCGVCEAEAIESNIGFLTRMKRGTPWVRLKAAASLDGRTALSNGQSKWITGPKAREDGQFYRACAQGLLTGIGTVLADDPRMNVRLEGLPSPAKFVLDSQARTPVSANILSGEKTTIFVSRRADPARVQSLRKAGAEVAELPEDAEGRLSLAAALDFIARSSVNELFVEAGARLSGRMLAEGLVDELLLYVAPVLLGTGRPIAQLPELIKLSDARRWRFVEAAPVGDDLKVRLRPSAD